MEDYPRTLSELEERFSTEQACLDYLYHLRWPNGFVCPRCGHKGGWSLSRQTIQCRACSSQTSVTAGTIFHRTRKPLTMWFRAIWWVTSQKTGSSALGLQRILGIGSYKTAWAWLHKIRRAMVRPDQDRLSGKIEVDETYWGTSESTVRGRQIDKKALIVIAAEVNGKQTGRIRMRRIPSASAECLESFISDVIEPGSTIHTDGWEGYAGVTDLGYAHEVSVIAGSDKSAVELLPRVHHLVGLFKKWLHGTHQGAVDREHLDYYLDEYTFRFNRRTSRYRGKLFYRLLQNAVVVEPAPYRSLVKNVRGPGRKKPKYNI